MTSIHYEQNLSFQRSLDFVFSYLADHSHTCDWAPSVVHSSKTTPGPVRKGTHFDIQMRFGMQDVTMDYHVTALEQPHYIELKGKGESFSIVERIRLEGDGERTHLNFKIEIYYGESMSRMVKMFSPIVKSTLRKDMLYLQKALDREPSRWRPSLWTRMSDQLVLPGMIQFSKKGFVGAKAKWIGVTEDLSGKTIVITGPTSGIGAATARQLAKLGAQLIFVCRNEKKGLHFASMLQSEGYLLPEVEVADISVVQDVEALTARFLKRDLPIHVLINNAGHLFNQRVVSPEGLELSFATLLLGPYVLTERLYPLLKKAGSARVINVSSGGMYMQALALDDMEYERDDYDGEKAFARAKRGLVDMTEVWAERWREAGICVHAMHPGWADTPGVSQSMPKFYELARPWLRTADQGADTIVWLAASQEAAESTGLFWLDRTPHTTAIVPGTRSARRHQILLAQKLEEYHQKMLPSGA